MTVQPLPPLVTETRGFDSQPSPGDRVAKTTCYMCACRCGIDVHLTDGPTARPASPTSRATATTR